jgi:hypothetical protein
MERRHRRHSTEQAFHWAWIYTVFHNNVPEYGFSASVVVGKNVSIPERFFTITIKPINE